MKKIYFILAAVAAMTLTAQAQVTEATLEVGDFSNPTEFYNGSFFDSAPTNFYLAHTGVQMIYTPTVLADLQQKKDVQINKLSFKFNNAGAYEDIVRNVKIYMQAIEETEFAVIEGVKQFFTFDNLVGEKREVLPMLDFYGEDYVLEYELETPFGLQPGMSLLVTMAYDAEDDDNCTWGTDYAPFYTTDIRSLAMTYTDNWTSFLDYAQGNDFPDATAMLGCGSNVNLPVTLIGYTHGKVTAINEIAADEANDGAYYNLMGQKFTGGNMPAGIYIHNGQKVIVR